MTGAYVSNRQTEIPTHFCWVCKKIFIFPDNGREHDCLSCGPGTKLLAYFDDLTPPNMDDVLILSPGVV